MFWAIVAVAIIISTTSHEAFARTDAPGSIGGTVTDAQTDLPIANAVVTLQLTRVLSDPDGVPTPTPTSTPTAIIATTTTNALGQYSFANVLGSKYGTMYVIRCFRPGYFQADPRAFVAALHHHPSASPATATLYLSDTRSAIDIPMAPLVQMTFVAPPPFQPLTYTFSNYSGRDVTVVAWGFECRNTEKCDPANTQTKWAGWRNRKVLAIPPDGTPATFTLEREKIPRGFHNGYSAQLSYCYFTSFDPPYKPHNFEATEADDTTFLDDLSSIAGLSFDIVTWPTAPPAPPAPTSCRTLLIPPPSDWP